MAITIRLKDSILNKPNVVYFKQGDYVNYKGDINHLFRIFKVISRNEILILNCDQDINEEIKYIKVIEKDITLYKKSPLKYFTEGTTVYVKTLQETGWEIKAVAPSPIDHKFDIIECTKKIGAQEFSNHYLAHEIIPDRDTNCYKCGQPLSYKTHLDCPICRYYKCSSGHCECNTGK
ncbi:hypothetical protein [Niallia nealsonii]|uniref:Uncharacterized protein n=1 Tax=Niallia nealsonii TaxID=115979 RepID=A0A2N0YYN3_9BACI|nr:hypothetical protein [Niallia nealsonii]PKG22368.1 hypothetical protein CWS01_17275 [Niallia nealsonii]